MAVKPFYVSADIEGRSSLLEGGPKSKEGTIRTTIKQRNKGEIETAFSISSITYYDDGKLYLATIVYDSEGKSIATHKTEY